MIEDTRAVARFWAKTQKSEGCWRWACPPSSEGYGRLRFGGKMFYAHRLSFMIAYGDIPDGLVIDHICHNRICVRPDHLRAVTQKQNIENLIGAVPGSRSGVRGVHWSASQNKWLARVKHHGKTHHLGSFTALEDAAQVARDYRNLIFTHNNADRVSASDPLDHRG